MKLRNKKTGEIVELYGISCKNMQLFIQFADEKGNYEFECGSLDELNEEWEYVEETKEYFYIYADGDIYKDVQDDLRKDNGCKDIGNYFETKEEAEKAVEKLEAITRLKSCKFKFKGWRTVDLGADKYYFVITAESDGAGKGDLDLLFGGGE